MRTAVSGVIPSGGIVDVLTTLVVALILCGCAALIFWIVFGPDFETSPRGARRSTRPSFYVEVIAFSFLAMLASSVLFLFSLRNGEHPSQPGPETAAVARLPAAPAASPSGTSSPEPAETASAAAPASTGPVSSGEAPPAEPAAEASPASTTASAAPELKPSSVPEPASTPPDVKPAPALAAAGVAPEGKPVTAPAAEGEAPGVKLTPTPAMASAAPEGRPATTLQPAGGIADIAPASGTAPEASPTPASSTTSAASPAPSAATVAPTEAAAATTAVPATPTPVETANVPPNIAATAMPRSTAIDILMQRGDELRDTGDFAAARLFYERAAEEGSAAAARAVGETYDPIVLGEAHARGVRSDPKAAASWYRKAIVGGDALAQQMLQRLTAKFSG